MNSAPTNSLPAICTDSHSGSPEAVEAVEVETPAEAVVAGGGAAGRPNTSCGVCRFQRYGLFFKNPFTMLPFAQTSLWTKM